MTKRIIYIEDDLEMIDLVKMILSEKVMISLVPTAGSKD